MLMTLRAGEGLILFVGFTGASRLQFMQKEIMMAVQLIKSIVGMMFDGIGSEEVIAPRS
jgi:hypothetical protein